jgi:uncharacterized protein
MMGDRIVKGELLHPGSASGEILVLDTAVSFWGGFDPTNGMIIEAGHPQSGEKVTGKVLVMYRGKGSAGTPAGVAESIRNGSGPIALVLCEPEVNIAIGAAVASELYDIHMPVVSLNHDDYVTLASAHSVVISTDGTLTVRK